MDLREGTCDETSFGGCVGSLFCRSRFSNRKNGRHWFRLMSDPHEQFCWTTRLCRVMLLRRGTSLS